MAHFNLLSRFSILSVALAATASSFAQIAIKNATAANPDSRAMLDLNSVTLGLLAPRMSETERAAITAPANSLLVFQNDNPTTPRGYYYNDASVWRPVSIYNAWTLGGNTNTLATDYVGTTVPIPLVFKTNNTVAMTVTATGQLVVGATLVPTEIMEVNGAMRLIGDTSVANSAGAIRYNPATGAHEGNITGGVGGWYQLENALSTRYNQAYKSAPVANCAYPSAVITTWPLIDDLAFSNVNSSSTLEVPYSSFWEEGRHEYLYRATDFAALNICPGTDITKLAFSVTGLPPGPLHSINYLKIRMKNTFATDMNAFDDIGLQTHMDLGNTAYTYNIGWNGHNLSVPFQWNGAGFNVVVDVSKDDWDWTNYLYNASVDMENTSYVATMGQYCDACGSLYTPGTCFWTGTANSIGCVVGPPPTQVPINVGSINNCWGHTGGASPQPWTPATLYYSNSTDLTTCDGTLPQYFGGRTSSNVRPLMRMYAMSNAVTPVTLYAQYLYTQEGLVMGTPAFADGYTGAAVLPNQNYKGPGTLSVQKGVWGGSVLLSDHVFDKYYDGTVKPEDAAQAASYEHMPADKMMNYMEVNRHLPTMDGRAQWNQEGMFSADHLASQLWVTVEEQSLYIKELNDRMNALQQYLVQKRLQELKK